MDPSAGICGLAENVRKGFFFLLLLVFCFVLRCARFELPCDAGYTHFW